MRGNSDSSVRECSPEPVGLPVDRSASGATVSASVGPGLGASLKRAALSNSIPCASISKVGPTLYRSRRSDPACQSRSLTHNPSTTSRQTHVGTRELSGDRSFRLRRKKARAGSRPAAAHWAGRLQLSSGGSPAERRCSRASRVESDSRDGSWLVSITRCSTGSKYHRPPLTWHSLPASEVENLGRVARHLRL